MKAVHYRRLGSYDVLEPAEIPTPVPGEREVRIHVRAVGVNPVDSRLRSGEMPLLRFVLPIVPGQDAAGVVDAVGKEVARFHTGDAVFGMRPVRSLVGVTSEYAVLDESWLARIPEGMTFEEAASIPLAAMTALQALRDLARLAEGQSVLVVGASGGVGVYAVQIAKALGARVVGVSSGRKAERVLALGADEVVDYEREDVWSHSRRFDVVFDVHGKTSAPSSILDFGVGTFEKARAVLKPGGTWVTTEPTPGAFLRSAWSRVAGGAQARVVFVRPSGDDLRLLATWVREGRFRPVVAEVFPWDDVGGAHAAQDGSEKFGKIVVRVAP